MVVASGTNSWAKEMAIRRRVANIFNKREEDFPSLKEYNDYLEEVEDMTFNLVEGIDVAAIEAKIAKYQEENAEQIINSRARKAEELAAALRASRGNAGLTDSTDMLYRVLDKAPKELPADWEFKVSMPPQLSLLGLHNPGLPVWLLSQSQLGQLILFRAMLLRMRRQ
ncbi:uncharacterized protein [Typha angustifolia]|uniref:uncharacterized protein isoform X2 n=1 Tax=Typha angustifolia TaxID=59011 RepID=UPI003C2CEBC0